MIACSMGLTDLSELSYLVGVVSYKCRQILPRVCPGGMAG